MIHLTGTSVCFGGKELHVKGQMQTVLPWLVVVVVPWWWWWWWQCRGGGGDSGGGGGSSSSCSGDVVVAANAVVYARVALFGRERVHVEKRVQTVLPLWVATMWPLLATGV
jgi:hypothetical protein